MRKPHKSFGSQPGGIDSRARVEEVSADRPNEVPAADVERPGSELQAGSKVGVRRSSLARITERLRSRTFVGALQRKPK